MVNVTKANFLDQSNDLLQHLPTAAFVAIDEEMTGISLNGRPSKDDTPEQRYRKNKVVPEKYAIIQVGVALFHQHSDYPLGQHEFLVRRYNFYLFPSSNEDVTREVTLNPSSVQFLNQHNMDFNLWTKEGIPYVTTTMASTIIQKYKDHRLKDQSKDTTVRDPTKRKVELTKTEDINFHARAMASLREWIDNVNSGTTSFLLPACNGFLRRALYESIELEYPALITENGGPAHKDQIRVWRLCPEEKREREELLKKEAWERMVMEVGFWRVFTAIVNACRGVQEVNSIALAENVNQVSLEAEPQWKSIGRNIPLVVHNGLMDLLFLMTHFHSHQLPDSYLEAKALITDHFPVVYDTKVLSTECLEQSSIGENTVLGNLYTKFVENDELFDMSNKFQIADAVGGTCASTDQLHEAAYDAFMTGAVFVALSKRIMIHNNYASGGGTRTGVAGLSHLVSNDADAKELFGRNKLYLMLTLYTIDLANPLSDPLRRGLSATSTYLVAGIDPSIITSDIVRCLSNLTDTLERRVHFEIVWVDDQTFMVAARHASGDDETLQRHGRLILSALERRFAVQDICTLEEHMAATSKAAEAGKEQGSWWAAFWGLFGYRKRKFDGMEGGEPSAKRRRTS